MCGWNHKRPFCKKTNQKISWGCMPWDPTKRFTLQPPKCSNQNYALDSTSCCSKPTKLFLTIMTIFILGCPFKNVWECRYFIRIRFVDFFMLIYIYFFLFLLFYILSILFSPRQYIIQWLQMYVCVVCWG